jgi:hypothetical protein
VHDLRDLDEVTPGRLDAVVFQRLPVFAPAASRDPVLEVGDALAIAQPLGTVQREMGLIWWMWLWKVPNNRMA